MTHQNRFNRAIGCWVGVTYRVKINMKKLLDTMYKLFKTDDRMLDKNRNLQKLADFLITIFCAVTTLYFLINLILLLLK